jgi:hypothetical protein
MRWLAIGLALVTALTLPNDSHAQLDGNVEVKIDKGEIRNTALGVRRCVLIGTVKNKTEHNIQKLTINVIWHYRAASETIDTLLAGHKISVFWGGVDENCDRAGSDMEVRVAVCQMPGVSSKDCLAMVHITRH